MRFTIKQWAFRQALGPPTRIANTAASTQAVGSVLLDVGPAEGNAVVVTGTDFWTYATVWVEAEVAQAGKTLVPARRLFELVAALEGDITVETANNRLHLYAGSFSGSLPVLPVGNFPAVPSLAGDSVVVPAPELVMGISQTLPATSKDPSRPTLNGVQLRLVPGQLFLTASDMVRIAQRTIPVNSIGSDAVGDFILPRTVVGELRSLAKRDVTLTVDGDRIAFEALDSRIVTSGIAGDFPTYEKLWVTEPENCIRVNRAELSRAVRRVALLADDEHTPVSVESKPDERLLISNKHALDVVQAAVAGGFNVAYNTGFLLDGLDALVGDEVVIEMNESNRPSMLSSAGRQVDFRYLLMPVRVNKPEGARV